jgi:molecular chaperone GrpE (heat shock protein)
MNKSEKMLQLHEDSIEYHKRICNTKDKIIKKMVENFIDTEILSSIDGKKCIIRDKGIEEYNGIIKEYPSLTIEYLIGILLMLISNNMLK